MKNFNHYKQIKRVRISENRNLKKGIRLNRNERVENFKKNILLKIFKKSKNYDLGKYHDQALIYKKLSHFLKLKENKILVTSGIDGGIKTVWEIFSKPGDKVGILSPTYAMYEIYNRIFRTKLAKITYDPVSFRLKKNELTKFIKSSPSMVFIPNPNQPIEDPLSIKEIDHLCKLASRYGVLIIIDEAYYMFGCTSAISLINKHKNLIILRSFSKAFGIPSIRLGFIISNQKNIQLLSATRLAYESNYLSDTAAIYFLKNIKIIYNYINQVKKGRDFFKKKIQQLGFNVIGGKANFLLINFNKKEITKRVYYGLLKKCIYVKGYHQTPLDKCLLLTCGPKTIMHKVYKEISKII